MILIPGSFISIVTFPGVIIHEMAHRFFADIAKIPVYKVCYFRVGNPAGYVIHDKGSTLLQCFLIAIGPLIVNTILCMLITCFAVIPFFILGVKDFYWLQFLSLWLGLSIGMHAFPSNHDADIFINKIKAHKGKSALWVISFLFGMLIKTANALRVFWFDLLYAFGISFILPHLLF